MSERGDDYRVLVHFPPGRSSVEMEREIEPTRAALLGPTASYRQADPKEVHKVVLTRGWSILLIVAIEAFAVLALWLTHHRCFDHRPARPAAAAQHGAPAAPTPAVR